jgi:WD40 repeat protein
MLHRIKTILVICFSLLILTVAVAAQETDSESITPNNITRLVEHAALPLTDVAHVEWSPSGTILAAATPNGVYLFDSGNWTAEPVLLGDEPFTATDLAFSPDGDLLAIASGSQIRLWSTASRRELGTFDGNEPIAFSPNGNTLAFTNGVALVLFDVARDNEVAIAEGHTDRITDVVFSPAGGVFSTTSLDMTLRYWDDETGEQLGFQRSRRRPLLVADVSPNGAIIASGARRGVIRILNMVMTTERTLSMGLSSDVTSVDFGDMTGVLVAVSGNTMQAWNTSGHEPILNMTIGDAPLIQSIFSPDETYIATIGQDDMLRIWAVED